jgi:hypothetical protein
VSLGSQKEPNRVSQLGLSAAASLFGLMPERAMLKPGVGSAGDAQRARATSSTAAAKRSAAPGAWTRNSDGSVNSSSSKVGAPPASRMRSTRAYNGISKGSASNTVPATRNSSVPGTRGVIRSGTVSPVVGGPATPGESKGRKIPTALLDRPSRRPPCARQRPAEPPRTAANPPRRGHAPRGPGRTPLQASLADSATAIHQQHCSYEQHDRGCDHQ